MWRFKVWPTISLVLSVFPALSAVVCRCRWLCDWSRLHSVCEVWRVCLSFGTPPIKFTLARVESTVVLLCFSNFWLFSPQVILWFWQWPAPYLPLRCALFRSEGLNSPALVVPFVRWRFGGRRGRQNPSQRRKFVDSGACTSFQGHLCAIQTKYAPRPPHSDFLLLIGPFPRVIRLHKEQPISAFHSHSSPPYPSFSWDYLAPL